jgi:hypothetical protein
VRHSLFVFFSLAVSERIMNRKSVSRRYCFPLRAGHKTAHLCTETTEYNHLENLEAPKKWFKANVDTIMHLYGETHRILKEDLFLGMFLTIYVVIRPLLIQC